GMNKITFVLFAFVLSITITIATPRPTYAEGPLLGTVRCLLETVLLQRCKPAQTPPSVTPPPEPAPPSKGGAKPSAPAQPASPSAPKGEAQAESAPAGSSSATIPDTKIARPEEPTKMAPEVRGAVAPHASGANISRAEYLAFFNTYSR